MKIKNLWYVLMGTMLIATSCSDSELENGNGGSGAGDPVKSSALVNVYSDKSGSEASLLAGNVLVKETRTLTLNVPADCEKVYMKYNTVSGSEVTKEFALSPATRSADDQKVGFNFETNRVASVTLALPEDAVQPTDETDEGYLFYHNTGVVMFEDGWPTQQPLWYDEDFNDVVFEYDLKVTECHDQQQMDAQGGKEELLLTLDVRAVGGIYPTALGVVLSGLESKFIDKISASLVLKGGQGTMTELEKKLLSTENVVSIRKDGWNWDDKRVADKNRVAILSVDKTQPEGTVIILEPLVDLKDNNDDMFQVVPGKVKEGLPMLRAEIRLIGAEGLTRPDREAQLTAFRELILDTNRQNFFIKVNGGKEIHMKGYEPTSAYKDAYDKELQDNSTLDANVYYSNNNGSTWGIKLPVGTRHACEFVPFKEAYPKFLNWVNANGASNKDWYLTFDDEKTIRYW